MVALVIQICCRGMSQHLVYLKIQFPGRSIQARDVVHTLLFIRYQKNRDSIKTEREIKVILV